MQIQVAFHHVTSFHLWTPVEVHLIRRGVRGMSPNRWKYFRWLAIATVFFIQPNLSPAADFPEEDEYQIAVFTSLYRKYSSEVDLLSEDALNSDLLPSESNLQQQREKRDVETSGDDVDECLDSNLNTCLQNCTNTDGGYNCSCFEGYEGEGNNCTVHKQPYYVKIEESAHVPEGDNGRLDMVVNRNALKITLE